MKSQILSWSFVLIVTTNQWCVSRELGGNEEHYSASNISRIAAWIFMNEQPCLFQFLQHTRLPSLTPNLPSGGRFSSQTLGRKAQGGLLISESWLRNCLHAQGCKSRSSLFAYTSGRLVCSSCASAGVWDMDRLSHTYSHSLHAHTNNNARAHWDADAQERAQTRAQKHFQ